MPALAAAPPSAPAAAPSPAPPKAADQAPPTPPSKPVSFDEEIDADLAALDDTPRPPERAPVKPAAKPKAPVKPPEKQKAAEPEEPETPPAIPDDPTKPVMAADLRGAFENLKKKVKSEYEPEIAKLRAKLKEVETRPDPTALTTEMESIKKRRDELEAEIRYSNYQKSQEYLDNYEKPYQEAWTKAVSDLSELTVENNDGSTRTATAGDLLALANMPLGEARKHAMAMFGDAANDVMDHRRKIRELSTAQQKALDDAKKNSAEHEKQTLAKRQVEQQKAIKLWETANQSLAEKYPKWFKEIEGDTEGNALLKKGFAIADLHFVGSQDLSPEQIEALPPRFRDALKQHGQLPIEDRVAFDALLRHKIASHSRLAHSLKTAQARISELEATVAEYEKSEPPAGRGSSRTGGAANPSLMSEAEAELDAIDRQNR